MKLKGVSLKTRLRQCVVFSKFPLAKQSFDTKPRAKVLASGLRRCNRIGRFSVQTPLEVQPSLGGHNDVPSDFWV